MLNHEAAGRERFETLANVTWIFMDRGTKSPMSSSLLTDPWRGAGQVTVTAQLFAGHRLLWGWEAGVQLLSVSCRSRSQDRPSVRECMRKRG